MALNKEQEDLYRKTMEEAKAQLETIDEEMEKEIQKARETLANLQDSKRSFRQLYEGAARLLGIKVEVEEDNVEVDAKDSPKEGLKEQIQIEGEQDNKDKVGLSPQDDSNIKAIHQEKAVQEG